MKNIKNALSGFEEGEVLIASRCLKSVLEGPFLPEWEFSILIGYSREEVRDIFYDKYKIKKVDMLSLMVCCLGNLTDYPHGMEEKLPKYTQSTLKEIDLLTNKINKEHKKNLQK